jgi:inhibitor of cysteine peptidase
MLISVGLLSGCILRKPIIKGTGTIVYNDFEGGFYGIETDFSIPKYPTNHLDPINLPQEFKEEGLRVWFKVRLRPDLFSFHMWGIMVEILEIKRL